ncbi:hypothetical protein RFM23_24210 [Mesorhizobium abyssinicae]|uniref:Uncharacterized protein n=1 Tax=Mesorhizobium abyssinicae TaxID=1209958 RepID=A0ABU5ATT8_9HYPH|nr:hypothetical protein [Mesorhizobium abyssinicae]MDX8540725.1 hypothetical protein [Mesorhizobium abyssinicae]
MTSIIATEALLMASTLAFALDIKETNDVLTIDARWDAKTYPCSRQKALPAVKWESGCAFVNYLPEILQPA